MLSQRLRKALLVWIFSKYTHLVSKDANWSKFIDNNALIDSMCLEKQRPIPVFSARNTNFITSLWTLNTTDMRTVAVVQPLQELEL